MDALTALRLLATIVMVMFLPGYLLVNTLFPARGQLDVEMDQLYRFGIGMVLSIFITIGDGIFLNTLGTDSTGHGYITGPNLWITLSIITVFLFVLGWYRGAYPKMGEIHPKLYREPKKEALVQGSSRLGMKAEKDLAALMKEKKRLERFIEEAEETETQITDLNVVKEWSDRRIKAVEKLAEVNHEIDRIRRGSKKAKRVKRPPKKRKVKE